MLNKVLYLHCNYETKIQINRKNSNTTKELKLKNNMKMENKAKKEADLLLQHTGKR